MRKPYFVSAPLDFALAGGASIIVYAVFLLLGVSSLRALDAWTIWSYAFVFNGLHFAATNFRLYRAKDSMSQYPLTAALVPLACVAGLWASLQAPERLAPYFVKLYLLWSPYHYSGQALGLCLVYAARGGRVFDERERLSLRGFIYGSFITSVAKLDQIHGRFLGMNMPSLGLPAWLWQISLAVTLGCGLAFLALAARSRHKIPPIALVPPLAHFVWLVPGASLSAFFQLVPMFHGLQYLLIAWFMQMQTAREEREPMLPPSLRWLGGNAAGYAVLFWAIPIVAARLSGQPFVFAAPVALAAVQIHHFFVDGVIWRLRDPKVGAPLMQELA